MELRLNGALSVFRGAAKELANIRRATMNSVSNCRTETLALPQFLFQAPSDEEVKNGPAEE
jgi:hypothetical protein